MEYAMEDKIQISVKIIDHKQAIIFAGDGKLDLLGSSSKDTSAQKVSIMFTPERDATEVVAVRVGFHPEDGSYYYPYFVTFFWKKEKLFYKISTVINEMKKLVGGGEARIFSTISREGDILVYYRGMSIATCSQNSESDQSYKETKDTFLKAGMNLVSDANLLCSFLADKTSFKVLEDGITESNAKTIERLRREMQMSDNSKEHARKNRDSLFYRMHSISNALTNTNGQSSPFGWLPWVKLAKCRKIIKEFLLSSD